MIGRTNAGGGGGASAGAIKKGTIVVSYPVGGECTVSNGAQTYAALDDSGTAAFVVEPGTWTVSATLGADSASQSVTVVEGGWAEVTLSFSLILFDANVSGGWEFYKSGDSTAEISDGLLHLATAQSTVSKYADAYYSEPIDLTEYNALVVDVQEFSSMATATKSFIGVTSDASKQTRTMLAKAEHGDNGKAVSYSNEQLFLDISAVDQMAYVYISATSYAAAGSKAAFKISRVALRRETVAELGGTA